MKMRESFRNLPEIQTSTFFSMSFKMWVQIRRAPLIEKLGVVSCIQQLIYPTKTQRRVRKEVKLKNEHSECVEEYRNVNVVEQL